MGITLNVWIFSGIIGVAYIMGYLMSRTMGRMLAVEGADPEEAQRETPAWLERVAQREKKAQSGRAVRQESTVMPEGTAWSGTAAWEEAEEPEEMIPQGNRAQAGRAYRQESRAQAGRAYQEGRSDQEPNRDNYGGETREWQKSRVPRRYRSRSHRDQQAKPAGHPIASPVAGQVDVLEGQGRRGVLLTPEDNKVYAPASGKIIRLYPRGNEFLLRTDSGVVLRLQAGERDAEMTRDYFRPRIMQNEFVGKGKLLLEYDREALARDGYDTHVSMTVEEGERSYDLSVTGSMWVKNGQDCLWVL